MHQAVKSCRNNINFTADKMSALHLTSQRKESVRSAVWCDSHTYDYVVVPTTKVKETIKSNFYSLEAQHFKGGTNSIVLRGAFYSQQHNYEFYCHHLSSNFFKPPLHKQPTDVLIYYAFVLYHCCKGQNSMNGNLLTAERLLPYPPLGRSPPSLAQSLCFFASACT